VRRSLLPLALAGCLSEPPPEADDVVPEVAPLAHPEGTGSPDSSLAHPEGTGSPDSSLAGCSEAASVYSPFRAVGHYPTGSVAAFPWIGATASYPDGLEDFRGYGPTLPARVECSDDKGARDHLDVTDGCLTAATEQGATVGKIGAAADGAFRMVALGYVAGDAVHPIKWTDQAVEYRFRYHQQVGALNNPGFKAFVRYRSEDDLYVASWRMDGVVQIQKKQCGVYTALAVLPAFGAPTPNAWHTIKLSAIGTQLELALDGQQVLAVANAAFSWGTSGIRIDAMNGAWIDDWRVSLPTSPARAP